ncbi:MAG: hypothetical protein CMJ81_21260 [Planctomycetaceae bacterium]|nr:hypothetical protein [Planctomycetaceae bacterium]
MSSFFLLLVLPLATLPPLFDIEPADDDIRADLLEARDHFEQRLTAARLGTIHQQANKPLEYHPNTGRYRFATPRDRAAEVERLSYVLEHHQFAILPLADLRHGRFGVLPVSGDTTIYSYRILQVHKDLVRMTATRYTNEGASNGRHECEFLIQGPTVASLANTAILPEIPGYYVVKFHEYTTLEGTTRPLPLLRELDVDFDDLAEQRAKRLNGRGQNE